MKRIILMAPSTACSERIWHILTRMLVPTKLLGSFDLPLSGLLCFLTFLLILYSLILLIIEDDGFPKLKLLDGSETPPWWNPYRILFTVLCANQPFLVASLTATKCWKSIDLKHPPTEGRFIGRQIFLRTIPFLFPHLFHEDYLLSALPLSDWKRLTILIYLVNWFLLNRLFLKVIILARLQRPETGKKNKVNNVVVNNYTSGGSGYWESMDLEHPPLLKTLAIYTKLKGKISDLLKFVRGKNREENPLVEFDSTNNSAYESGLLVSNSEYTNSREESKRPCMTERVLGSVDSTTRISSTDFDAADNTAHLGRACQSGPVVSLSGNENSGEASKKECITKRMFGLEDLQQNSGGRHDNAAKSFGAIYDPGIHSTHSLAQNSFKVVEALPTRKQPNESVPLLSLGRLTLEGCVQEEKSQDLPRLTQIDGVEQRVTKSPRYLEGFTAQSTCSSPWPIGLPDGRHIVVLNLLEKSTKNVAHVAMADQCSPTVPLPEKKMVRRTLKREYRTMSVIFSIHQQHFGKRCEGNAKSFRVQILLLSLLCLGAHAAMRIFRNHGINCVSMVKRIHKQHGINQWPFRQKWATWKGHSMGEKRPYDVSSLSMDLARSLKLDCSGGLGAQSAVGLPDGGYVLYVSEKKIVGKTLKRKCKTMSLFSLEDDQQHGVRRWGDAAKSLGGAHAAKHIYRQLVSHRVSRAKRIRRQHGFHRWPFQQNWATLKGYFLGDERPVDVISLSMDGKLVSRFQLIHISWLGIFSPWPPALPPGGEIVGPPLALSSSQLPYTSNRPQLGGQDRSGSTASHSENERTTDPEPEGRKRKIKLTIEDLRPHVGLKCAVAAKKFQISQTTFKRYCRELGIRQWPDLPIGEEVLKPPDPPERNTRQFEMVNEAVHLPEPIEVRKPPDPHERTTRETEIENEVVVHLPEPIEVSRPPDPRERNTRQTEVENVVVHHVHEPNHRRDYFDSLCRSEENDSMDLQSFLQEIEAIQVIEKSPLSTAYPNPNSLCRSEENDSMDFQSVLQEIEAIQVIEESPLSTAYPNPNLDVPLHPQVVSTQMVSGNTGIPNDQRNLLAFQAETHLERRGTGTTYSNPASSQDTSSVMLKVYGLRKEILRFQFPLTSGIDELKGEVAMRLKLQQDSFDMHYEDDERDKILIPIDKDLTNYLSSSVNPVIKLWVVPSPTDLCGNCGASLKR